MYFIFLLSYGDSSSASASLSRRGPREDLETNPTRVGHYVSRTRKSRPICYTDPKESAYLLYEPTRVGLSVVRSQKSRSICYTNPKRVGLSVIRTQKSRSTNLLLVCKSLNSYTYIAVAAPFFQQMLSFVSPLLRDVYIYITPHVSWFSHQKRFSRGVCVRWHRKQDTSSTAWTYQPPSTVNIAVQTKRLPRCCRSDFMHTTYICTYINPYHMDHHHKYSSANKNAPA